MIKSALMNLKLGYEDPEQFADIINERAINSKVYEREELIHNFETAPGWQDTITIIPARSGSSRLENKNIKYLNGLPLMAYTILLAKQIDSINRVFVSTDSQEYAEIATHFGAEVPFLRPKSLSQQDSLLGGVIELFHRFYVACYNCPAKRILVMLPTNPFRNVNTISKFIEATRECSHFSTIMPVKLDFNTLCINNRKGLVAVGKKIQSSSIANNRFYKSLGILSGRNHHWKFKHGFTHRYFQILHPVEAIDIDSSFDFSLAEMIMNEKLYDFGFDPRDCIR